MTAEGYEPRKMPLSELLEQKVVSGPSEEAVVTLQAADNPGLAWRISRVIIRLGTASSTSLRVRP